ncbi:MAG: glucose-1-phosphate thymidylyltransferase RfbA [Bdellovibrionales bacterium]|nr:glucose-1-phosphate thymidylyltransferase RfbA [Bdellovibrionales bacterium]
MSNQTTKKGIILAGGSGTRLFPATKGVSKQLLSIYNKPMVYYPLSSLLFAGLKEILIITTPEDQSSFQRLLGDGSELGISISYAIQPKPEGLAQAFIIGEEFLNGAGAALALGDNVFYGHDLPRQFEAAALRSDGATVFGYQVADPERYGVVEFDSDGKPSKLVEKPKSPKSPFAVTGIYFYDDQVVGIAKELKPSARGELEITDLNTVYLERSQLYVEKIGRGVAWLDTGTHESLLQASLFVQAIEERQGMLVGAIEEVVFRRGYIDATQLEKLAKPMEKTEYGKYLLRLARGESF